MTTRQTGLEINYQGQAFVLNGEENQGIFDLLSHERIDYLDPDKMPDISLRNPATRERELVPFKVVLEAYQTLQSR